MTEPHGHRRFVRNVVATIGGRFAAIVLGLLLTTVFVRTLGLARYGTWSFFAAFVGHSSVFDFGLSVAVERAVARALASGAPSGISDTLNTGLAVAAGVCAVLWGGVMLLPSQLWAPLGDPVEVARCIRVLPLCLFASNVAAVCTAGLTGLQQATTVNALRFVGSALTAGVLIALVGAEVERLDLLLLIQAAGVVGTGVAAWLIVRHRVDAPLFFRPWAMQRGIAGELVRLGGTVQASTIAVQAGDQAMRAVLGTMFGPAAMGTYDLTNRAAIALRSVSSAVPVVLVPFGQARLLVEGADGVARVHALAVKYLTLALVPGSAAAVLLVVPGLAVWLGPGVATADSITMARMLLVMHAALGVTAAATALGRSLGVVTPELVCSIAGTALGVAAVAAAPTALSAVAAFCAVMVTAAAAQAWWLTRRLRLAWLRSVHIGLILVTGMTTTLAVLVALAIGVSTLPDLMLASAAAFAVAAATAWSTGILTPAEVSVLGSMRRRT